MANIDQIKELYMNNRIPYVCRDTNLMQGLNKELQNGSNTF